MTANRDFKHLVRKRMRKTGESYTAARRHFLRRKEEDMTNGTHSSDRATLNQPVERLDLTLKTLRFLRQHGVQTIRQLSARSEIELAELGLPVERCIEIREVLASRGM
jgi:DNA-directed RNA polymerase alpha subunit